MPKRARKRPLHLHDYLFPNRGNGYKPHLFRTASLTVFVLGVLALQGAYFAQVHFIFPKTNFLATVLPGALIDLTNADRTANDVPTVTEDPVLTQAAQAAANDMATKGYFAHVSPDGKSPWYWLQAAGYNYQYAGENLAVDFTDSDQVETAWMNSPTHRANIVKAQYTKVGIAVANGMYQGKAVTFVVQFFATPEAAGMPEQTPSVEGSGPAEQSGTGEIALARSTGNVTVSRSVQAAPTLAQVLGTETAPAAPHATTPAPTQPRSTATASTVVQVQPATKAPTGIAAFLDNVLTSPTHSILYILSVLIVFVLLLLTVELLVKVRLRYVEMTGGGLALLALLFCLLIFNIVTTPHVQVSASAQETQASPAS